HFATVYLLDDGPDATPVVRMAGGASATEAIASTVVAGARPDPVRVPRWALEQERALAPDDVVAFVARSWEAVLVGPAPRGAPAAGGDLFAGALPEAARWLQVPVIRDGAVVLAVPACLLGDAENREAAAIEEPPFTLAGDIFEAGGHGDLIRLFLPLGLDTGGRATGVLEVGYHRSAQRR